MKSKDAKETLLMRIFAGFPPLVVCIFTKIVGGLENVAALN
jgi:hypothetical protein